MMAMRFPSSRGRGRRGFPFPLPQRRSSGSRRQQPIFGSGRRDSRSGRSGPGGGLKARLLIAAAIAVFALISYYGKPGDVNEITGETERVAMADEAEEIQLGLRAAPQMVNQHGGPSLNLEDQRKVRLVGQQLLSGLDEYLAQQERQNPYRSAFRFTLLADDQTVNAFALPGGPVFITQALYDRFTTVGQLAGVLGHEIGHVLARHSNKQMAKQGLFQGLAGAVGVLGGDVNSARMGQMISSAISMSYGREHELESDKWGVRLMLMSGYDPRSMIDVMKILDEAGGGGNTPEFFSTHPKPKNRIEYIKGVIDEELKNFPNVDLDRLTK